MFEGFGTGMKGMATIHNTAKEFVVLTWGEHPKSKQTIIHFDFGDGKETVLEVAELYDLLKHTGDMFE